MDTFMDKLAQKLNAQEMIKANSAADAEEMDQLKNQLREYDECLAQMQQVNKELRAVNHAMETLMSETIAPEVTKLSEESVAAIRKMQQENTEKLLPKRLVSMEDMIYELSEGKQEPEYAGVPMYVLTNSRKSFGAACLLYDGALGECFRRLEESYYLIPSSVHEVILIPASAVADSRELCALVQEMNRTQVRGTEVLSDTVYLYSEETRRLEMIDF